VSSASARRANQVFGVAYGTQCPSNLNVLLYSFDINFVPATPVRMFFSGYVQYPSGTTTSEVPYAQFFGGGLGTSIGVLIIVVETPNAIAAQYGIGNDSQCTDPAHSPSVTLLQFAYGDVGFSRADIQRYANQYLNGVFNNNRIITVGDCSTISSTESTLDIEMVIAVCPTATVNVVCMANTYASLVDFYASEISQSVHPTTYSISYVLCETSSLTEDFQRVDLYQSILNLAGAPSFYSSGDNGAACGSVSPRPMANPSLPSSVAVGGTVFINGVEEACSTIDQQGITTGGGFSELFPIPDYQTMWGTVSGNSSHANMRGYPDISCVASYIIIAIYSSFYFISGTSASAPILATIIARGAYAASWVSLPSFHYLLYNSTLLDVYNLPSIFNDVKSGSNCADMKTGLFPTFFMGACDWKGRGTE